MKAVINRILVLSISLVVLVSCGLLTKGSSTSVRPLRLYNPGQSGLHPDYKIYHNKTDESTLYFRVFTSELLFNQANPETRDQSALTLEYSLYSSFSEQILDHKDKKKFVINKSDVADYYTASVKIPTEDGKSYYLEIELTDQIRQTSTRNFLLLDRFNPGSQQNFLLLTFPGNNIGFEKFYYKEERFRIISNRPSGSSMRLAYYKPVTKIPDPPYMIDKLPDMPSDPSHDPDSVWIVDYDNQKLYSLEDEGIYVFYPNTETVNGMYLTNLGDDFPQVKKTENMLAPLQYIASQDEYAKLIREVDIKKAIDEFWLDKGGSFATARELIRVYYNRVVFANLYFTTDRQGWLTDRGMIYLLMGPPAKVNKTETAEIWVYLSADSKRTSNFEFRLTPHPVKAYEFELKRTENHRPIWNSAVKSWNEGRIFSY